MTMAPERMTTVKVSTKVRDQINELAAARGLTANSVLEKVLEEALWREKVELAKRQMRAASPEVWAEYMEELDSMDASLMDGLEDDPWEG
jgi:hypothetical protein